jgi:hypothetical protein
MLRRVALVRTDVSEELSASFIRMTRIGDLETTLSLTSNRRDETSALTRATWRNIPGGTILHSHRRENLNLTIVSFIPKQTHSKSNPLFIPFLYG